MWYLGHATIHHPRNTDEHDVAVIELLDEEFMDARTLQAGGS